MVVTRAGFSRVVANAFAGLGFPTDAPTVFEFPTRMFLPGSDLTPLDENIDKIIYGLTKWEPQNKQRVYTPSTVRVTGKDYREAVAKMKNRFLQNLWGDGLSLEPATKETVDWILTGTDLPRDKFVAKILPRSGIATVELIAVNLAMAGGRPEYLPTLIAAVEAMTDPRFHHERMNSTTCSVYPAVIVNGPAASQIRLNSGYGCLGPDPRHPAGAVIGRALRLLILTAGGAVPGFGTMAIFGGPARYTNIVFAEDEEGSPWAPLHVERGFLKESNVVTIVAVASTDNMNGVRTTTEDATLKSLTSMAAYMRHNGNWTHAYEIPGVVLLARNAAGPLADLGWTKTKVKEFLWEHTKVPLRDLGHYQDDAPSGCTDPCPITSRPENFMLVVAGGDQSGHGYWMQTGASGDFVPVSKELKLPANWNDLLIKAKEDLGPLPTMMAIS
ncbi:MAG: hypothetical protein HYX92_09315 [Chloroflexi bacterium]|nr:hypothetical protein [Chloroflexota bacterium]